MSKVAILGSTGMIGSHLKALLKYRNIDFIEVSRSIWDLRDWKTEVELDIIFKDIDTIFHFAAVIPTDNDNIQSTFDVNVRSSLNLAKWATQKNIRIIYLSSSSIYKEPHELNIKESSSKVLFGLGGFYGYSKLLSENVFNFYVEQGLLLTILRPTSVYGYKLGENNLISRLLNKAKCNEIIDLPESNNKINFIHSIDVANAALCAYLNKSVGIFNISANQNTSIVELAEVCIKITGTGKLGNIKKVDKPFVRFDLNSENAKNSFNYNAKINIEDGINAMYNKNYLESSFK